MSYEFKVFLDGISLDAEQEHTIRVAIQRVVMDHLASIDLGGDRSAAILPLAGDGGGGSATQGIRVLARPTHEIEDALRQIPGADDSRE
ncbi:MAG TPA: hypothetical protein VNX67_00465 [Solirubrobacteraceae bacterium]|jgi:hypothetical protein|nr:hypothetical protein [Solirubrobacteraceae bacterium]